MDRFERMCAATVVGLLLGALPVFTGCAATTRSNLFTEDATAPTMLEVGSSVTRGEAVVYARVDDLPVQRAGTVTPARGFTTILRGVAQGPRTVSTVVITVAPRNGLEYRLDRVTVKPGDRIRVHVGSSQMSSHVMVSQGL